MLRRRRMRTRMGALRAFTMIVVLAALVFTYVPTGAGTADGPVVEGPPNAYARTKASAVVLDGKIYLIGGSGKGTEVEKPPTEVFDPISGTWTAYGPASYPDAGDGGWAVSVNGRIYFFGGKDDSGHRVKTARVFDPATGTWRVLPGESTMGHADGCVAVVGTRVYLFGGEDDSLKNEALDYTKAVDVFDAATETWSTAAPMPFPRQDFCAVTVGTTIFTVGGQGGVDDTALDVMDGLETKTDTWFGGMTLPYPWEHPRAAVVNDKVYLLSGKGEGGDFIFEFDPATREFAQKPSSLLTPRFECAVVAFGGKIYIFTGKSLKGDMLTSTEIYDPSLDK